MAYQQFQTAHRSVTGNDDQPGTPADRDVRNREQDPRMLLFYHPARAVLVLRQQGARHKRSEVLNILWEAKSELIALFDDFARQPKFQ